jgi:hypothetical protein
MTKRVVLSLIAALPLLASFPEASDDGALFTVDVRAGFDDPTRNLLARLPQDFRDAIVNAMKTSLPLIQSHFDQSLDEIQTAVQTDLASAQCVGDGTIQQASDSLHRLYPNLNPWSRSNLQRPIDDLKDNISSEVATFSLNSPSADLNVRYADILFNIELVRCQVRRISPQSIPATEDLLREKTKKLQLWLALHYECENVGTCLSQRYEFVSNLIKTARSDDKDKAGADSRFAKLANPSRVAVSTFAAAVGGSRS